MIKESLLCTAILAATLAPARAADTTLTGKIVDLPTYMTHDHNMDSMKSDHAMKGDSMKGDAMKGDSMKGDSMKGDATKGDHMMADEHAIQSCPGTLGLVAADGKVYLLTTQMGSSMTKSLCGHLGQSVALNGTVFNAGGATALLVSSLR